MWRLVSVESASTDDGLILLGPVGVSRGRALEMWLSEALVRGWGSTLVGDVVETGEVEGLRDRPWYGDIEDL